jgi:Cys-tRNA(Pro) deacylase
MKPTLESLQRIGIPFEVREFPEGTRTSRDAANALGCDIGQIAKSIVFSCNGQAILVIASGPNRVDTVKIEMEIGDGPVEMMAPDEVKRATGFVIGGVPPLGHKTELRKFIDEDLLKYDVLWTAAGTPRSVFSIRTQDLVRITGGKVMDVKE